MSEDKSGPTPTADAVEEWLRNPPKKLPQSSSPSDDLEKCYKELGFEFHSSDDSGTEDITKRAKITLNTLLKSWNENGNIEKSELFQKKDLTSPEAIREAAIDNMIFASSLMQFPPVKEYFGRRGESVEIVSFSPDEHTKTYDTARLGAWIMPNESFALGGLIQDVFLNGALYKNYPGANSNNPYHNKFLSKMKASWDKNPNYKEMVSNLANMGKREIAAIFQNKIK